MARTEEFEAGQPQAGLSESDRALLEFARTAPSHPGHLNNAIAETFGVTGTTYFQRLNRVIDDPEAMKVDAQTVKRYQRIREAGQQRRSTTGF